MDNLFYSESERILFYIPNYYLDSNSNAMEFSKNIEKEIFKFANIMGNGQRLDTFKTKFIESSTRYKRMRVFWKEDAEPVPEAFHLTKENDWTMWKWIEN
jgi:hypothetical protein